MHNSGFKFIDLPTAAERLGTTRNELLRWVAEGRIKPFSGGGQQSVFRASDVEKLVAQLGPSAADQSPDMPPDVVNAAPETAATTRTRRRDAIKLVGTRISMDSRWAEISEKDVLTWLDALEPVQFERVRNVATLAIDSLQRLLTMLDEHERKLNAGKGPEQY